MYQISIAGYEWIIGLGLSLALALILTVLTYKHTVAFFIYFTIFTAFMIYAEFLPLWTLILEIIVLCIIIYNEFALKTGNA